MERNEFKWKHFAPEIILWCVRWYGSTPMSYANLSDMLQERGISVNRSTIYRWFIEFAPSLRKKVRRYQMIGADSSWQLDETYSVPGFQGEHGSLNEPRVYLKYTSAVAGANLCLWLCLVVQAYESERQ